MILPNTGAASVRLDAAESAFFLRQLEAVDQQTYEVRYPALRARSLIPTQPNIPDWARVYTWREYDKFGTAKFIANTADDLPRADAKGAEASKIIKPLGASYGYDIFEVKAAAAMGTPLDAMKANACRYAIENKVDSVLALGDTKHNLQGLLSLTSTTSFTVGTKQAGGLTWGTLAAPNATGDEVAADLMGIVSNLVDATKGLWARFKIVLPIKQYNYAAQKRLGSNSDTTALRFALDNSPFIESIEPWYRCSGAGAGATDRMVAYPLDPMVLAGIVPMEYTPMPVQQENLEYIINAIATCAGVVARYPVAISYGDGI